MTDAMTACLAHGDMPYPARLASPLPQELRGALGPVAPLHPIG